MLSPLGSADPRPSSVTCSSSPASGGSVTTATGGSFALLSTRTVTVSVLPVLPSASRTVSSKVRSVGRTTFGAVNVGEAVSALESATGGVPVRYTHE